MKSLALSIEISIVILRCFRREESDNHVILPRWRFWIALYSVFSDFYSLEGKMGRNSTKIALNCLSEATDNAFYTYRKFLRHKTSIFKILCFERIPGSCNTCIYSCKSLYLNKLIEKMLLTSSISSPLYRVAREVKKNRLQWSPPTETIKGSKKKWL